MVFEQYINYQNPMLTAKQSKYRKTAQAKPEKIYRVSNYCPERYSLPQGFTTYPSQQILFASGGKSNNYAEATWRGGVDISQLTTPLRDVIKLTHCQIEVYLNNHNEPPLGQQLNKECLVVFKPRKRISHPKLLQICRQNGTKLAGWSPNNHQFAVLIPHFSRFSFKNAVMKKQKQSDGIEMPIIPAEMVRTNAILQNRSERVSSHRNMFSSMRQMQEATEPVSDEQPSTRMGQIMDSFRVFAEDLGENIYKREVPYPTVKATDSKYILKAENMNRKVNGYVDYRKEESNLPALQNFMLSARGQLAQLRNYPSNKKITLFSIGQARQSNIDQFLETVLKTDELTPQSIASIVCTSTIQIKFRGQLSLYAILFQRKLCFQFDCSKEYSPMLTAQYQPDQRKQRELLRDWLTWIIRKTYPAQKLTESLSLKTGLMGALALRNNELVLQSIVIYGNLSYIPTNFEQELQKMASDKESSKGQTLPEVKVLLSQSVEELHCRDWLLCLGISSWYFKPKSLLSTIQSVINLKQLFYISQSSMPLFRLFQLFIVSKEQTLKTQLIESEYPTINYLISYWLITNKFGLKHLEQQTWKRSNNKMGAHMFRHHKYEVSRRLVEHLVTYQPHLAGLVCQQSRSLSITEKQTIKKIVSSIGEKEGQIKNKYRLQSISQLLQMGDGSEESCKVINELLVCPELLGSYRRRQNQQMSVELSKKSSEFQDLLLINSFQTSLNTGIAQLKRVLDIYEGFNNLSESIGSKVKGLIQSKVGMLLIQWDEHKKQLLDELKAEAQLKDRVRQLIGESKVLSLID